MKTSRPRQLLRFLRWGLPLAFAGPTSRRTAADLIERRAATRRDHPFVRFEGRTLSYGEWNAAANRLAHWALAKGFGPGDVVGLLMENRPEYLIVWAGLAKAGVTTALLNTSLSGAALSHALRAADCRSLIAGAECAAMLADLGPDLPPDLAVFVAADPGRPGSASDAPGAKPLDEEVAGYSDRNPDRRVRASLRGGDSLFYIYTSGTTGLPKAARFSHSRFLGGGLYSLLAGFGRRDTLYCPLPLYHTVGGVMSVNAVLSAGGTLALRRRFSARSFWDDVVSMRATAFQYIGEVCRYLLNQPPHPAERQHRLRFCVGNGLRPDIWQAFQSRFRIPQIVEFYGATEANVSMVNLESRPGSVGRLAPGMRAELIRYDVERDVPVRDAAGHCVPCALGEAGELLGRISEGRTAAGRFEGYASKQASEQKILRDVFEQGDAWFRSGDLLRRDADGFYYFVDRIGDTFRWKGENVSTQEVAEIVTGFEGVLLSSVYGVELPDAEGRAGMAALVLEAGREFDANAFYGHVERALPRYARPAFVRLQTSPELTATFKLRKLELQREGFDPARMSDPLFFRDDQHRSYLPLTEEIHDLIHAGGLYF